MGAYDIDAGVVADPFGPSVELQPLPPAADAEAAPALGGLAAGERESVKQRYELAAYAQLRVDPDAFAAMDPVIRNKLITRFYAGEYLGDPDSLKWAGMAAYGSQTVGEAMMESRLLDDVPVVPGLLGAPRGEALEGILADGNAGLFQQIGWQHVAFEQGGMEALQDAFIDGDLPVDQLIAWQQIADAKAVRVRAEESGDADALRRAEEMTWAGNGALLSFEQNQFLQGRVYEGHDEEFRWLTDHAPLRSPIPGGASFQGASDGESLADREARWRWVGGVMTDEWRRRDGAQRDDVLADMEGLMKIPLPEGGAPDWYPE